MIQGELLRFVGGTLYGENAPWGARMADDLRVNRRTIQRWIDGTEIMPTGVWLELDMMLLARLPDIERARDLIIPFVSPARKESA